jgi:hypothetical protein
MARRVSRRCQVPELRFRSFDFEKPARPGRGLGRAGVLEVRDGSPDTLRLRIWFENDGEQVIYDSGVGQPLGGGQLVIHRDTVQ